ncbi:glycosyltransferase family 4 protein [Undibacterium sp.]|uniref:glycosyltransferase family 4 protein n=1 Tax=Undibacterium sp. TaxID=1914977 RepID=UPI00272F872D|nr:glycosyltransferase family 4 protein [Undibacterium sp.]MDP1980134.1 glycosyltransferase family 4 protein [Undibacterium sp.]
MKILFVHQNFPGQFVHLAPALAADAGNEVVALSMQKKPPSLWNGVKVFPYQVARGTSADIHPWLADSEPKVIRGEAAMRAALQLREQGFVPDVIIAHPGWGESLFLKTVWPKAKLGIYAEFFYHASGADVGFDPEFSSDSIEQACKIHLKNINNLLHIELADAAISPTHWQASTFPSAFRERISVIHDGINTDMIAPNPGIALTLGDGLTLTRDDEVITFVNRNLEPYRGYHIFMRALPQILAQRPNARVLIVGGDDVSYGAKSASGKSWKEIFLSEVSTQLPESAMQRIHFLGNIPYQHFIPLLQLSRVHVYLTYPFVLSWSLLEAMSAGCAIVASNTRPLHEAIRQNETGRLVDFFDAAALTQEVCDLLDQPEERQRLGENARRFACEFYDLQKVCLPAQLEWVQSLAEDTKFNIQNEISTESVVNTVVIELK